MLKITNADTTTEQKWILSGQLTGPWAVELLPHWDKTHATREARKCVVDLSDVTFIDENGENVFRTGWQINFICNLGYGQHRKLHRRAPRLGFEEACRVI